MGIDVANYHGWSGRRTSPWLACAVMVRVALLQVFRRKSYWIVLALGLLNFLVAWSVIPFDAGVVLADINVGILYVFAISSLEVYGVIMGGWASNSKYPFLGALRSAQLLGGVGRRQAGDESGARVQPMPPRLRPSADIPSAKVNGRPRRERRHRMSGTECEGRATTTNCGCSKYRSQGDPRR